MALQNYYDYSKSIKFNYKIKPGIAILLKNPLTKQSVIIENAIIDSGSDETICTSNIALGIGHTIKKSFNQTKPGLCSGVVSSMETFRHSAIIYLVDPITFKPFNFIKPINLKMNVMKETKSIKNQRLFLLGINPFFEYFMITLWNYKKKSLVLTPKKNLIK